MKWYLAPFTKFATFNGRARRKEYWTFALINAVLGGILGVLGKEAGLLFIPGIFSLLIVLPTFAVAVRRLHDTGKSGWYLLFGIIPLLGQIMVFIRLIKDSDSGNNNYGSNPKEQRT